MSIALVTTPTETVTHEERPSPTPTLERGLNIVVFSCELDRLLATLTLATTSAAMGTPTRLFFAFWGAVALRKDHVRRPRSLLDRIFAWLLPKGTGALKLSQMHMGGLGTAMMKRRMRAQRIPGAEELLEMARELGVELYVCEMSLSLLGMRMDDLIEYPGLKACGAASFLELAGRGGNTLFI